MAIKQKTPFGIRKEIGKKEKESWHRGMTKRTIVRGAGRRSPKG